MQPKDMAAHPESEPQALRARHPVSTALSDSQQNKEHAAKLRVRPSKANRPARDCLVALHSRS